VAAEVLFNTTCLHGEFLTQTGRSSWRVASDRWPGPRLLPQAQPGYEREIPAAVLVAQGGQTAIPLSPPHSPAAPAGRILLVGAHVLVQLVDTSGEQRHLDFRRTGVRRIEPILIDDLRFAVLRDRHRGPHQLRRILLPR